MSLSRAQPPLASSGPPSRSVYSRQALGLDPSQDLGLGLGLDRGDGARGGGVRLGIGLSPNEQYGQYGQYGQFPSPMFGGRRF